MKHIYQQRLGTRFVWSLQYEWSECCWLASFLPAKTNRCPHPFVLDTCSCICWTPVSVSMRTSTEQKLYCSCLVYMLLEFYIREYFKVFALSLIKNWVNVQEAWLFFVIGAVFLLAQQFTSSLCFHWQTLQLSAYMSANSWPSKTWLNL